MIKNKNQQNKYLKERLDEYINLKDALTVDNEILKIKNKSLLKTNRELDKEITDLHDSRNKFFDECFSLQDEIKIKNDMVKVRDLKIEELKNKNDKPIECKHILEKVIENQLNQIYSLETRLERIENDEQ